MQSTSLNTTLTMTPNKNKSFKDLFLDKVKPTVTKDKPKRYKLDTRANVMQHATFAGH